MIKINVWKEVDLILFSVFIRYNLNRKKRKEKIVGLKINYLSEQLVDSTF